METTNTLILITGASRGIGQALAVAFAKLHRKKQRKQLVASLSQHPSSSSSSSSSSPSTSLLRLCLIARTRDGLDQTAELVRHAIQKETTTTKEESRNQHDVVPPIVEIIPHVVDLSDLDTLEETMNTIFRGLRYTTNNNKNSNNAISSTTTSIKDNNQPSEQQELHYDQTILLNNAGSLGPIGPSHNLPSLSSLRTAVDLNVTSSLWLSSRFVHWFGGNNHHHGTTEPTKKTDLNTTTTTNHNSTRCTVVNISSLCAIQPFETMGTYCAGKAARDMFHTVLSKELSISSSFTEDADGKGDGTTSNVRILNYAPGVVDTKMTVDLSVSKDLDEGLSAFYRGIGREGEGRILNPEDTAKRLVELIEREDGFVSGSHIDYWDLEK